MAKVNGMNIEVVAGRVKSVDKRTVRDKALTILRIEGFDFAILVWEAEVSVKEGDCVFAEGRIQSRSYEKDGEKQYVTEIIAHRVTNLSEGKAGNAAFAIGNLGRTPAMRYTSGGKAVTNVSLAATTFGSSQHPAKVLDVETCHALREPMHQSWLKYKVHEYPLEPAHIPGRFASSRWIPSSNARHQPGQSGCGPEGPGSQTTQCWAICASSGQLRSWHLPEGNMRSRHSYQDHS